MLSIKNIFKKSILKIIKPNRYKALFAYLLGVLISVLLGVLYHSLIVFSSSIVLCVILNEIFFRTTYYIFHKKRFPRKFNIKVQDIPIEAHPYLPWVYKKNYNPPKKRKIYEDRRQGYMLGGIKTNNIRHVNGPDGGRDVIIPKPEGMIRILCLGDSTTCNYLQQDGQWHSWPLMLEKKLQYEFQNLNLEVNNCGMGGYNTNEILIKFLIDSIDTCPDIIVLYHAFVNIRGYITPNFERDFSHFRRKLKYSYPLRVKLSSIIPDFGLQGIRFLKGEFLSYLNFKEDLIGMIDKQKIIDKNKNIEGIECYERNIETLIHVCKGRNIKLILSTYSHHLYESIQNHPMHVFFHNTVMQENEIIKNLARKHHLTLVDNQKIIEPCNKNFTDEVHPTVLGMDLFAKNFSNALIPLILDIKNGNPKTLPNL